MALEHVVCQVGSTVKFCILYTEQYLIRESLCRIRCWKYIVYPWLCAQGARLAALSDRRESMPSPVIAMLPNHECLGAHVCGRWQISSFLLFSFQCFPLPCDSMSSRKDIKVRKDDVEWLLEVLEDAMVGFYSSWLESWRVGGIWQVTTLWRKIGLNEGRKCSATSLCIKRSLHIHMLRWHVLLILLSHGLFLSLQMFQADRFGVEQTLIPPNCPQAL